VRVISLPSRVDGPVLTSMLIVSCFAVVLPGWMRSRRWQEMEVALPAILFWEGFVLQRRARLVGVAWILAVVCGDILWRGGWWLRSGMLLVAVLVALGGMWLLQHNEVATQLVERADAGRFELWQLYLREWTECGLLLGCGPGFSGEIRIE